jgi:hypothetical protein
MAWPTIGQEKATLLASALILDLTETPSRIATLRIRSGVRFIVFAISSSVLEALASSMTRRSCLNDQPLGISVQFVLAGSTGRRNTGVKSLGWGFKLQGLTWSFVELTSHFVQMGLRVHRQVGALAGFSSGIISSGRSGLPQLSQTRPRPVYLPHVRCPERRGATGLASMYTNTFRGSTRSNFPELCGLGHVEP